MSRLALSGLQPSLDFAGFVGPAVLLALVLVLAAVCVWHEHEPEHDWYGATRTMSATPVVDVVDSGWAAIEAQPCRCGDDWTTESDGNDVQRSR